MENIVVSFSGGRTSAFMAKYLKDTRKDANLIYIFANTGKERQETLDFVNECDKRWNLGVVWVEYDLVDDKSTFKIVDYETASRNGVPFEKMIQKYGLPNISFPHCSRELKVGAIRRYLRSIGLTKKDYCTAIGIRADETHRIDWGASKRDRKVYPLVTDIPVSKEYIRNMWDKMDFDLDIKDYEGNCDMCWKKSQRKLLTLILQKPELVQWWIDMEIKYGGEDELVFFTGNMSGIDLVERAKRPFSVVKDEHESNKQQCSIFDYELDTEYDCFCKST